ncbi:MAG: DUF1614 domain-containing protein [Deltaproteobacteria bacterium]|nr:DUF1614 domain-containing protein [Deltaproteobacteria bacterium]
MFFGPFLAFYAVLLFVLLAGIFVLLEIGAINYAFGALGLPPELALMALMASLIGSYINIPVAQIESGERHVPEVVTSFGVRYRVPLHYARGGTTLAVNVGGAIVPVLISIYVLSRQPAALLPSGLATLVVGLLVHRWARPVRGLGIAIPMFIPPIIAAVTAWVMGAMFGGYGHVDAIAYVGGVVGTLIGADVANLDKLRDLAAPVASIGGAGTFDGVFLTGIVAVLLA